MDQWLGLYAFTVGLGNKILQAMWHSPKRKDIPNHFVVHLKLTQYYKSAIVQFKKKMKRNNFTVDEGLCREYIRLYDNRIWGKEFHKVLRRASLRIWPLKTEVLESVPRRGNITCEVSKVAKFWSSWNKGSTGWSLIVIESLLHTRHCAKCSPRAISQRTDERVTITPAHFADEDNRGPERKRNLHRVTQPRSSRMRVTNKSSVVNSVLLTTTLYWP